MHTTDETIDIVDEHGNIIGQSLWSEAHEKGLRHPTVAMFLFKDQTRRELLVQRRSLTMKQEPGLLAPSAGGHVTTGQTIREGMLRELHEELFHDTDLPDIPLKELFTMELRDIPGNVELMHVFEGWYDGPFRIEPGEVAEVCWMKWDDVIRDMKEQPEKYTIFFRKVIGKYKEL